MGIPTRATSGILSGKACRSGGEAGRGADAGGFGSESSKTASSAKGHAHQARLTVELNRPQFALRTQLTCSLPPYQTACGATDILSHILERYCTNTPT